MNNINFRHFNQVLEKTKVNNIPDRSGETYVLQIAANYPPIEDIDFEAFSLADVLDAIEDVQAMITDEDTFGNIRIDPQNPFAQVLNLTWVFAKLEQIPRTRGRSPYLFI